MRPYSRKGRPSRAHRSDAFRSCTIEQLERREMMAADLAQFVGPLEANVAASASLAPSPAVASSAAQFNTQLSSTALAALLAAEVRTADGTANNVAHTQWGSTDEQLLRIAAAEYADGISTPAGTDRPSAREISNVLAAQGDETELNDRQLSAFIYAWGQFIDHDLGLTEPPTSGSEKLDIAVPAGDTSFDPNGTGTQTIAFTRSRYDATTGTSTANPREQTTSITTWIDGSMVYGSDAATAASLRTLSGGHLKTSAGNLPPTDAAGNFLAGDTRANENVELTSLHALFVREHNQWADRIAAAGKGKLSDDQIYQTARKLVIAEIQAITYNEFLPALLGRGAIDRYQGYDATANPGLANEFSTAAFRLGHTLINDDVEFFGNDGRAVRDEVELAEAFFNPALLKETGADPILKYLGSTLAQEFDNQIVDSLRNFLFGQPGQGGLDLASLNIQRGRDHGLADYNATRVAYGLAPVKTFADITSDVEKQQKLQQLYGTVDNIDLWVGALAEDHVRGSSVGELVQTIVADQFKRLRDGDRLWYQNVYKGALLSQLDRTTLADVIQRNTTVNNIQANVFYLRSEIAGQAFVDAAGDGRYSRNDLGLAGVAIQLLDHEGEVVAATTTDSNGRYRFTSFAETGDYQVRIVLPTGATATTAVANAALVSRGEFSLHGLDFGVQLTKPRPPYRPPSHTQTVDAALATFDPAVAAQLAQAVAESTTNPRTTRRI